MNLPTDDIRTGNKEPEKLTGVGRRRFIHGIGIAAPFVLSVKSPSALAAQCVAPSARASMDLLHSREGRTPDNCSGRTPLSWINLGNLKNNHWKRATGFTEQFSTAIGTGFSGKMLSEVMQTSLIDSSSEVQLGAFLAAAYLNRKNNAVPDSVLRYDQISTMWTNRANYVPTAGVTWTATNIVTYLNTTMPVTS